MKDKLLSTITFCKRIAKLVVGFDLVKNAMMLDEVDLVLIACDLSPKTKKEIKYLCNEFSVEIIEINVTLDEFWYLIGKRTGIIGVKDEGFAQKIQDIVSQM